MSAYRSENRYSGPPSCGRLKKQKRCFSRKSDRIYKTIVSSKFNVHGLRGHYLFGAWAFGDASLSMCNRPRILFNTTKNDNNMGIFDLLLRKNREKPSQKSIQNADSNSRNSSLKRTGASESLLKVEPFIFTSNCHQRYENGNPVLGLQQCIRTVRLEKNINGCDGYRLEPGIGYIVKIFNNDTGKPNMSDKPMKVVNITFDKIELRGFPIEAQTPFGWQEVDYRDYGFTVSYKNSAIEKCTLHMLDRNIDIEYRLIDDNIGINTHV